ncbi:magnesium transporter [Heliorestis acidaminivorans]|uniref:Magnesium transporter MgtE n=1 Tax=Heliorestis acidaminivorans TaxID=553427 RepID=A0A6I0ETE9_9FIRM|nr:magnesium transporter [Heliorestis acidaminivorans]KAB2953349.1 magnesium transporter [Heliorestis acidaminivorans]
MIDEERKKTIEELVHQKSWLALREELAEWPLPEVADLLLELEKADRVLVFRMLPRRISGDVFSYMESEHRKGLLKDLTDEETRHLLASLTPDDRTTLFEELPGQVTQHLLNLLSAEDLHETRQLLGYPEESVGRLMTPDYVAVRPEWSVSEALDHIRNKGKRSETINVIYVTDDSWKLLDALELQKFILARSNDKVQQIMDDSFVSLNAFEDREQAVFVMQKYDLFALPVVDTDGVLIGMVTIDDVFDVAQKEATEDFHKGAAVTPLKTSYREASVWSLYRKRVGWLMTLVVVNLASSGVIAAYEDMLSAAIALAFFIPLLIDSGGNAGAQSATLMVRAIATGDIKMDQWVKTISKEMKVGIAIGLTMALGSMILGYFRGGFEIGIVVGLTMITLVVAANIIGTLLPFLLLRLRFDPAVASGPLITSIIDAVGLLIYFSIATVVLGHMG